MNSSTHIKVLDKYFQPYISAEKIDQVVTQLAKAITQDHANDRPLFIAVLNGAFIFASDFLKKIPFDCEISFIKTKSYEGTSSTGEVLELIGLDEDIKGRTVIILEDIVDTGLTIKKLLHTLQQKEPKVLKIATLLFKPDAIQHQFPIHYIGLEIPPKFVLGYGLDYNGLGRNYPELYQLVQ